MADVSKDVLKAKIQGLLKGADLETMTAKKVRKMLEDEYHTSFSERKKEISSIIEKIINESSGDDSDDQSDHKPSPKHSCKPSTNNSNGSKVQTGIKRAKTDSEDESGSSSCDEKKPRVDDEELARKLQEEEGGLRKTRSGGSSSGKSKTKSSKSKKKKSKRDISDDEDDSDGDKKKSKKKSGGGYMKSLPLSPELAEFTGESEMPRHAVVKKIWAYCKENNLYDPKNKQFAICDAELMRVMGVKRFRMFGMMKLLTKHFITE